MYRNARVLKDYFPSRYLLRDKILFLTLSWYNYLGDFSVCLASFGRIKMSSWLEFCFLILFLLRVIFSNMRSSPFLSSIYFLSYRRKGMFAFIFTRLDAEKTIILYLSCFLVGS